MWQRQDYQDGNQRALSFTMHLYLIQSRAFLCEFWEFAVKMKMLIDACKVAVCWSLGDNAQYTVNYSFILKSVLKWQNKSKPMKIKYYLDNNLFYYLFHISDTLTCWFPLLYSCQFKSPSLLRCNFRFQHHAQRRHSHFFIESLYGSLRRGGKLLAISEWRFYSRAHTTGLCASFLAQCSASVCRSDK